jgi:hypothetical protein
MYTGSSACFLIWRNPSSGKRTPQNLLFTVLGLASAEATNEFGHRADSPPGRGPLPPDQGDYAHPALHSSDAAIRGHVFCSFLALSMQKHLDDLASQAGLALLRDLDRLQQVRILYRAADWLVRTDAAPDVTRLFKCAHVALPSRARQAHPPPPANSRSARRAQSPTDQDRHFATAGHPRLRRRDIPR